MNVRPPAGPGFPFSCMEGPFTRRCFPLQSPRTRRPPDKDGRRFRDDPVAVRQLEVIRRLLREADGAVTATDTSREGQMVARNLYDYLGFKGKTERLWLSSLTDKAIREAFLDLRPTVSMKVCTWQAGHGGKPTGSSGTMQASRSAWQPEKEPLARTGTDTGARACLAPLPGEQGFQRRTLLPAGAVGPQGR